MTEAERETLLLRVLILAPTGKDAALTQSLLERANVASYCCRDVKDMCQQLEEGAGAVLLAEEAAAPEQAACLAEWLQRQPPWSDLPILVLARPGADSADVAHAMDMLGNVTVLERPTRIAALVSAVLTALRARRRQYQTRDHLLDRERNLSAKGLLAAIVASSDDAIISMTLDGNILSWNAGAERLFGYSPAEVIGWPITLIIPPERFAENPALLERIRKGERKEHFETVRITKDGRRIDVSLTVSPVRASDGQIIGASKVARDITEQKRAAERLRQSEANARRLLELNQTTMASMAEVLYTVDRLGLVTYLNPEGERLFGWKLEELLGRRMHDVTHYKHPDGSPFPIEECSGFPVLRDGHILKNFEDVFIRKDGTFFPVSYSSSPLRDVNGEIIGLTVVFQDITQRKQSEQALRDADRRKDEFLAILAHELRNPLAPIRNSLQILRLGSQNDPATDQVAEMMERQVNHMVRLVDDLMEVSRITRGKIELRKEMVEVASILRSAVETSRPIIDSAEHRLAISLPPEPLTLEGDAVRLTQVIANLLNNAAKYTPANGQIRLSVRREGKDVVITVADNGAGIPTEMLPRVFDLFTQVDHHADRAQGGLGIGLTLVKNLVEMHGGSVQANSQGLGKGSEFVVRLPLAVQHRQSLKKESKVRQAVVLAPRRVLVVDDNRDAAETLGMLLKILGAEVRVVFNGPAALEAMRTFEPAVVLLDIGMPGMDGHEVARRIRQMPEYQNVTLIAVTGWGQEGDRRNSKIAGFDHHLIKPADVGALETLRVSLEDRTQTEKVE
ncbi:MAG: PAS domain S-box protein [Planctomycetales bacterium]|nr:PAS domain S-box protein [Planctomycetales bacterium]